jgi:hypothetical protein
MKTVPRGVKGLKDKVPTPAGDLAFSPVKIRDWIDAGCPRDHKGLSPLEQAAARVIESLSGKKA